MKEKRVLVERRAAHQMQFICDDFVKTFFKKNSVPQFAVQDDSELRAGFRKCETIELSGFRRRIHK